MNKPLPIANDAVAVVGSVFDCDDSIDLVNAVVDGWVKLAPWGDYPGQSYVDPRSSRLVESLRGQGVSVSNDGKIEALQRIDADAGKLLVANANSLVGKVRRWFREIPIFNGHPDCGPISGRYDDKSPKGTVRSVEVRDDGIYALMAFNDSGLQLLDGQQKLSVSAYWDTQFVGADDKGRAIVRPSFLRSVGLTQRPNLPVPTINESNPGEPNETMDLKLIVAALLAAGIEVPNDAPVDKLAEGVKALADRAATAVTIANEKQAITTERDALTKERDAIKVDLANERTAHAKDLIALAIETGRITEGEAKDAERRLGLDFANESQALLKLAPKVKTTPVANGNRAAGAGSNPRSAVMAVVNELMDARKLGYHAAWAESKKTHPELHEALAASGT